MMDVYERDKWPFFSSSYVDSTMLNDDINKMTQVSGQIIVFICSGKQKIMNGAIYDYWICDQYH